MMKRSAVDVPAYFSKDEFAKFCTRLMPTINLSETTTKG